jgi:hypothetical protein
VTDDEFEVRLEALRSAVMEVVALLDEVGDEHWATWFADVQQRLERYDPQAFDRASSAFGGMGSFNDVIIHPANGHSVPGDRIGVVNEHLAELRGVIGREARELSRAVR